MKKILLLAVLTFVCISTYSQKKKHIEASKQIDLVIDSLSQYYTLTEEGVLLSRVIQSPNLDKNALYVRILELLSSVYANPKNLIHVQDKEQGFILGKGICEDVKIEILGAKQINTVHHKIKIEVKDYRFKVSITLTDVDMEYFNIKNQKMWEYHHPIFNFYPFNKEIKLKYRDNSFNVVKYGITSANDLLDTFEHKISSIEIEEW